MPNDSGTDRQGLRASRWLVGSVVLLGAAASLAVARSDAGRVVVYNETGTDITELAVTVCGETQVFHDVRDRESVRMEPAVPDGGSDIVIAANGVALWRGGHLEARGGHRSVVRLRRGGVVESTMGRSW